MNRYLNVFLIVLFAGLLVGFFSWQLNWGITGNVDPLPDSTASSIAFIRHDSGQTSIVLIKADGTGERTLITDKNNKVSMCWSPDGKQLCYAAEVADEKGKANQLFLYGGSGSKQITQGSVSKDLPQWRPNGKQIAFLTGGSVKVIEPNGTGLDQIYPPPHKGGGGDNDPNGTDDQQGKPPPIQSFRWSPDGSGIAGIQVTEGDQAATVGRGRWWEQGNSETQGTSVVVEPETLVLLSTLGGKPEILINTNSRELSFDWMPDSKRVAVGIVSRGTQHGIALFQTDEIRIAPHAILTSSGYSVAPKNVVLSPDGSSVAFELYRMSSPEDSQLIGIAVAKTDSSNPVAIQTADDLRNLRIVAKGDSRRPQWSPDGAKLLYTSPNAAKTGNDVWIVGADGSNPLNLTNGRGDNSDAAWSPVKR